MEIKDPEVERILEVIKMKRIEELSKPPIKTREEIEAEEKTKRELLIKNCWKNTKEVYEIELTLDQILEYLDNDEYKSMAGYLKAKGIKDVGL